MQDIDPEINKLVQENWGELIGENQPEESKEPKKGYYDIEKEFGSV